MSEKNFLRAFVDKEESGAQAGEPIRFTASTAGSKRDGIDLDMQDWIFENYRKNPVFLWAHDYWGKNLPLGRVEVNVENDKLMASVVFDQNDEFAKAVERKYRDGFLHTVSVGWNFVEQDKRRKMDLLDISGVPVPGDPDALMERQYQALKRVFEDGEAGDRKPELVWEEVAAEMVEIFDPAGEDGDEVRERRYRALLPKYRKLDKVAPEFLPMEDLAALDEKEIRGLFLEGEADRKKADSSWLIADGIEEVRSDLEKAMDLIRTAFEKLDHKSDEVPTSEGDGAGTNPAPTDAIDEEEMMLRAMESKIKLQMRSLK